jgi:hypothetical protein
MPTISKHEQSRRKDLRKTRQQKETSITYWNERLRREGLGMGKSAHASGPGDGHNLLVYWGNPEKATESATRLAMEKESHKHQNPGHGPDKF